MQDVCPGVGWYFPLGHERQTCTLTMSMWFSAETAIVRLLTRKYLPASQGGVGLGVGRAGVGACDSGVGAAVASDTIIDMDFGGCGTQSVVWCLQNITLPWSQAQLLHPSIHSMLFVGQYLDGNFCHFGSAVS